MSDKNFKVKTSITSPTPIALTEGGTGQTSANNALNALLPLQTSAAGKVLQSDGTNTSWSTISSYSAPTIGSTQIASGATVTTINGLTKIVSTSVTNLDANGYEQDFNLLSIIGAI